MRSSARARRFTGSEAKPVHSLGFALGTVLFDMKRAQNTNWVLLYPPILNKEQL